MAYDAILVERSIRIMAGRHEKKENNPENKNSDNVASKSSQNSSVKRTSFFSEHMIGVSVSVVASILVAALVGGWNLVTSIDSIESKISTVTGSIDKLGTELTSTERNCPIKSGYEGLY